MKIIRLYKEMIKKNEYVISKQLLRSGTSIGANVHEAQAAQSKKDFALKMTIASKEARETKYWLLLLQKSELISGIESHLAQMLHEIDEIVQIITKIVKTSRKSL